MQKILEMFRLKHSTHNLECQKYYDTCPLCQIIVDEQTDKYLTAIEDEFKTIVKKHWKHWDHNAYTIANETQPEILAEELAMNAFEYWLQPIYHNIEITDQELFHHSYVQQKIIEKYNNGR